MRYQNGLTRRSVGWLTLFLIAGSLISTAPLNAQHQGNSAYYPSNGTTLAGSGVYIDASQFGGSAAFCLKVNDALNAIPTGVSGAVVDARGINAGGSNTCSTDPFNGTYTITNGSVLLLPSGTISISAGWVIPAATRVIGEGSGLTIIKATSTLSSKPMLTMGSSACEPCQGVAIEELSLNGNNEATMGILNQNSQEHSYVRNVVISNVSGTGLTVNTNDSGNSGPYENLLITAGTSSAAQCVVFGGSNPNNGPAGLRGLHGLTCMGNGSASSTGIDLNTANTTVENILVGGFTNGIVVGDLSNTASPTSNAWPVQGVVLENIWAAALSGFTMTNLIELSNAGNCDSGNCFGTTTSDIDLLGINNTVATNTINDQLTGYIVTKAQAQNVAVYILGQPLYYPSVLTGTPAQMTRFTTVPSQTSWGTGSNNVTNGTCTTVGSFYSNTAGTSGGNDSFFACIPVSGGGAEWKPIL